MSYTDGRLEPRLQPPHVVHSHDYLYMETSHVPRHQLIDNLIAHHTDDAVDAAIRIWEQMANEIITIIGEGGFASLYVRSVFLTQPTFPLLTAISLAPSVDARFTDLKNSFDSQTPEAISATNRLLLVTFTDILAALIGEELTTTILRSAWGQGASTGSAKEQQK